MNSSNNVDSMTFISLYRILRVQWIKLLQERSYWANFSKCVIDLTWRRPRKFRIIGETRSGELSSAVGLHRSSTQSHPSRAPKTSISAQSKFSKVVFSCLGAFKTQKCSTDSQMLWKFSCKAPRGRQKHQLLLSRTPNFSGSRNRLKATKTTPRLTIYLPFD